ncbi:hypothetical protein PXD04_04535 [Methanosphaera sp. ISO3-F5]|uniref:hypothetical protein n=1 Tax=Methanosphaera sp. ISO3-F5 TaxID=1452353 RepID=UPI002B25D9B6|nr:hypothetical protein [Methanosphaera sp. ISO3-F5]WQH65051.1 hypothetical protein PXD04_04535 [Methanosphaera sp. ISO3-F5]
MSKESEIFLRKMFNYFKENNSKGRYLHYMPEKEFSEILAPLTDFFKEMDYVTYDSKKATITMITKSGQVYALKDIISFNNNYSEDLCIIGVGNKVSSVNHDAGGAVIGFQVNIQKYKEIIEEYGYDPDFEDNDEELDEEYIDRILSLFKSNNIKKQDI